MCISFLNVNLRAKFSFGERERERNMWWWECPTEKLTAGMRTSEQQGSVEERRSFSHPTNLCSFSLSEATHYRITAVAAHRHETTVDMKTVDIAVRHENKRASITRSLLVLSRSHATAIAHSSNEQRNGRVDRGTKLYFICYLTANILAITQPIYL